MTEPAPLTATDLLIGSACTSASKAPGAARVADKLGAWAAYMEQEGWREYAIDKENHIGVIERETVDSGKQAAPDVLVTRRGPNTPNDYEGVV